MCNGICWRYKVTPYFGNGSMYSQGYVSCMNCDNVYLEKNDCRDPKSPFLLCPCCKLRVRTKSRSKKVMELPRIG